MSGTDDIGCEQALKCLVDFIDHELGNAERQSVERHLHTCRSCFSRMEFETRLKQKLLALPAEEAPSASRDRIQDLIKRF
jgi:anti-sigma factor (TIGR02949 family)